MIIWRLIPLFLLCFFISHSSASPPVIMIGTDSNYWYPYSYSEKEESKGIHIDIVADAMTNLGFSFEFVPRPWKRALREAEEGKVDAVVSASFKPDRASYLFYPKDASEMTKSRWRIMQVEYVVISHRDAHYKFDGDLTTLPTPVRAPLGYSIIDDLQSKGIDVVTAKDIRQSMEQLLHSGRGVVVTARQNSETLAKQAPYKDNIQIHEQPFESKSYFMVFSKLSKKLDESQRYAIWEEVARLREDNTYMDRLFSRY